MDKNIKKIRRTIEKERPYKFHNILLKFCFIIFVIMIIVVVVMNFIRTDPVAFDENNTFTYTYIEVDKVHKLVDQYYVADDGTYVYLYYSKDSDIPVSSTKIIGVPKLINEDELDKLVPVFQSVYPDLKVKTVADLTKYTGNYYFDNTAPALFYDMQIVMVFSIIPFVSWLIILLIKIYYRRRYFNSLKNIVMNHEATRFLEELSAPRMVYNAINTLVLFDYLVINHPSPYVIDIDNIVWIYTEKKKFFFLFDQELTLVIYDQNLKKTRVLVATAFSNKNRKEINALISDVSRINPKVIMGYSQHNKTIFNQLKKG